MFAPDMNLGLVTGADGRPPPRAAFARVYVDHWSGLDPTAVRWGVAAHDLLIGGAELSEIEQSALEETGNIVCSAYANSLAKCLSLHVEPAAPTFARDMAFSVIGSLLTDFAEIGRAHV